MVFTRVLIVLFLFFPYFTFAQEDEVMPMAPSPRPKKVIKREVSFRLIEQAPVFPGCEKEKNARARKKCLQYNINRHVSTNFNVDLANSLGLPSSIYRIMVKFKINLKGNITNIKAKGPHPKLEGEAIRLIKKLPKMKPGIQRGQAVIVAYALPIKFYVEYEKPIKEIKK